MWRFPTSQEHICCHLDTTLHGRGAESFLSDVLSRFPEQSLLGNSEKGSLGVGVTCTWTPAQNPGNMVTHGSPWPKLLLFHEENMEPPKSYPNPLRSAAHPDWNYPVPTSMASCYHLAIDMFKIPFWAVIRYLWVNIFNSEKSCWEEGHVVSSFKQKRLGEGRKMQHKKQKKGVFMSSASSFFLWGKKNISRTTQPIINQVLKSLHFALRNDFLFVNLILLFQ